MRIVEDSFPDAIVMQVPLSPSSTDELFAASKPCDRVGILRAILTRSE